MTRVVARAEGRTVEQVVDGVRPDGGEKDGHFTDDPTSKVVVNEEMRALLLQWRERSLASAAAATRELPHQPVQSEVPTEATPHAAEL